MPCFSLVNLGCKANQYDGAAVSEALVAAGFTPHVAAASRATAASFAAVSDGDRSTAAHNAAVALDLVVVVTCCVTAAAMAKSRHAIRRAIRSAPGARVLVAGCYGDYYGRRILALLESCGVPAERGFVAGHHGDVAECVRRIAGQLESRPLEQPTTEGQRTQSATPSEIKVRRQAAVRRNAPGTRNLPPISRFPGHQRAFVKVQDGCDAFCAYCIVPYTRPVVWWRPLEHVERECRRLVAAGHKEIVLSGVFLGAYGRETSIRRRWAGRPALLPELVRRVSRIEGLWRARLSSLEPADADDALLAACAELPNFAPHFHLPLQSGSPRILRRMNRQYTADDYRRAVDRIRERFARPAVTTDIIVGFPGEDEDDFAATLDAARHAGFSKIHAFPFSAIEGTAAWTYRKEQPPSAVVRERMARLAEVERELADDYRRQFIGQDMEALVEDAKFPASPRLAAFGTNAPAPAENAKPLSSDLREAMTDRYITVRFHDPAARPGEVVRVVVEKTTRIGLEGRRTTR